MKIINYKELQEFITTGGVQPISPNDPIASVAGIMFQLSKNADATIKGEQEVCIYLVCHRDKVEGVLLSGTFTVDKFMVTVDLEL